MVSAQLSLIVIEEHHSTAAAIVKLVYLLLKFPAAELVVYFQSLKSVLYQVTEQVILQLLFVVVSLTSAQLVKLIVVQVKQLTVRVTTTTITV